MIRISVDYWYTFGRAISLLEECFSLVPCDLTPRDWSRISNAIKWLEPIASGEYALIKGTIEIARELLTLLSPLVNEKCVRVSPSLQAQIHHVLTSFHNEIKSGAAEIYTFLVSGVGAYSASALVEDSTCHLSEEAQKELIQSEKNDFKLSGACLACMLYTATGFHAMRALEAEARRYHMAVISGKNEVDWTLDRLINGNSGRNQIGLRDQWKKEGARPDSPLALIISLLSSINQIYRNPIMHPEMTLDGPIAKEVFDTAALAISKMVHNRFKRKAVPGITP